MSIRLQQVAAKVLIWDEDQLVATSTNDPWDLLKVLRDNGQKVTLTFDCDELGTDEPLQAEEWAPALYQQGNVQEYLYDRFAQLGR